MVPLYHDPSYAFHFADDRLIHRFHLEGVQAGQRVTVFELDSHTGERVGVLAKVVTGEGGWVNLTEPIIVEAGGGFVAVPVPTPAIRPETPDDHGAIRHVNRLAFGQETEGELVDALRDGRFVRLSLVAECGERVVGHLLFSDLPILTATGSVPALALAPMAVLPEFQNQAIGSELLRVGLEMCQKRGHRIVIVVGHPHFYRRFSFAPELTANIAAPFSGNEAFMALELVRGALDGVTGRVQYPPPFGVLV